MSNHYFIFFTVSLRSPFQMKSPDSVRLIQIRAIHLSVLAAKMILAIFPAIRRGIISRFVLQAFMVNPAWSLLTPTLAALLVVNSSTLI